MHYLYTSIPGSSSCTHVFLVVVIALMHSHSTHSIPSYLPTRFVLYYDGRFSLCQLKSNVLRPIQANVINSVCYLEYILRYCILYRNKRRYIDVYDTSLYIQSALETLPLSCRSDQYNNFILNVSEEAHEKVCNRL